jgi:hypothetical protein
MKYLLYVTFFLSTIYLNSCNKNPGDINEEELITTVIYKLDAVGNSQDVIMTFRDKDGNGGQNPEFSTIGTLKSGETYDGSITILNESVNPVHDITNEIQAEATAHQFFFTISGNLAGKVSITYDDKDQNNQPIGLRTKLTAAATGSGKLRVVLKHEPDKKAGGVSSGDITNAGGDTDVDVTFDVEVK